MPERLSEKDADPDSCRTAAGCRTTRTYSTASSRGPEVSWLETAERVGLRLDVYSPSQVLQTNGCFYHSPLPPWVSENCKQQGPFAPRTLLRFTATMSPSATLSSSTDFLGSPVIRFAAPPISRRDEEGFSSCLAHPCHRAAANTPPECSVASVSCGGPYCLRPFGAGSAPGAFGFSRPLCVHFRCGPMTRSPSQRWLCRSASFASFPPRMRS